MKLLGKKAIVTGANRSIGKAIAILFAQEGADVVISYRTDPDGAEKTVKLIEEKGRKGKALYADFSETEGVRHFFHLAIDVLGQVDILVNNAASYTTESFLDLDVKIFEYLLKIGVSAPMVLTQLSAKNMIDRKQPGSIINISSISGIRPYANRTAPSAAKAALNMLTCSTALELAQYNIRVNAIAPGEVPYEETKSTSKIHTPLNRPGVPMDQAQGALFLASDESSWVTGQILTIDGGASLSF